MARPARKVGSSTRAGRRRLAGGCLLGQAFVVFAIRPILPGVFTYGVTPCRPVAGSIRWPAPARKQDIMRFTQRAVILATAAIALLAPGAATTAAAASASPAR